MYEAIRRATTAIRGNVPAAPLSDFIGRCDACEKDDVLVAPLPRGGPWLCADCWERREAQMQRDEAMPKVSQRKRGDERLFS
jgi:recombinational DNA repair protein (RecF pathway)